MSGKIPGKPLGLYTLDLSPAKPRPAMRIRFQAPEIFKKLFWSLSFLNQAVKVFRLEENRKSHIYQQFKALTGAFLCNMLTSEWGLKCSNYQRKSPDMLLGWSAY